MRIRGLFCLFTVSLVLMMSSSAQAQDMGQSSGRNVADMKFTMIPPLPTCAVASVQSGNPATGPSIILAKAPAGCSIPWHWHTPNENVMLVSGLGRMDMKGGKPLTLRAGAFAMMASHDIHQFTCLRACQLYIYSDVAFDIHYVNKDGNEITPDEALKAVKEKVATEMK
jgi:quercetin dioxygenase-like cupin family protein